MTEAVAPLGYRPAGDWDWVCDLDSPDGILGYLGLPLVEHRDFIETTAVVGVLDPEVDRILRELRDMRDRDIVRTFGQALTPNVRPGVYRPYSIINHDRVDTRAIDRLVADVEQYGHPFMAGLGDRRALQKRIKREGLPNETMYDLPVLMLLNGESEHAMKLVQKTRKEAADLSAMARVEGRPEFDYDRFAAKFAAYAEPG